MAQPPAPAPTQPRRFEYPAYSSECLVCGITLPKSISLEEHRQTLAHKRRAAELQKTGDSFANSPSGPTPDHLSAMFDTRQAVLDATSGPLQPASSFRSPEKRQQRGPETASSSSPNISVEDVSPKAPPPPRPLHPGPVYDEDDNSYAVSAMTTASTPSRIKDDDDGNHRTAGTTVLRSPLRHGPVSPLDQSKGSDYDDSVVVTRPFTSGLTPPPSGKLRESPARSTDRTQSGMELSQAFFRQYDPEGGQRLPHPIFSTPFKETDNSEFGETVRSVVSRMSDVEQEAGRFPLLDASPNTKSPIPPSTGDAVAAPAAVLPEEQRLNFSEINISRSTLESSALSPNRSNRSQAEIELEAAVNRFTRIPVLGESPVVERKPAEYTLSNAADRVSDNMFSAADRIRTLEQKAVSFNHSLILSKAVCRWQDRWFRRMSSKAVDTATKDKEELVLLRHKAQARREAYLRQKTGLPDEYGIRPVHHYRLPKRNPSPHLRADEHHIAGRGQPSDFMRSVLLTLSPEGMRSANRALETHRGALEGKLVTEQTFTINEPTYRDYSIHTKHRTGSNSFSKLADAHFRRQNAEEAIRERQRALSEERKQRKQRYLDMYSLHVHRHRHEEVEENRQKVPQEYLRRSDYGLELQRRKASSKRKSAQTTATQTPGRRDRSPGVDVQPRRKPVQDHADISGLSAIPPPYIRAHDSPAAPVPRTSSPQPIQRLYSEKTPTAATGMVSSLTASPQSYTTSAIPEAAEKQLRRDEKMLRSYFKKLMWHDLPVARDFCADNVADVLLESGIQRLQEVAARRKEVAQRHRQRTLDEGTSYLERDVYSEPMSVTPSQRALEHLYDSHYSNYYGGLGAGTPSASRF